MGDFRETLLFKKISSNDSLKQCIIDIRSYCELLGDTIKNLIPGFTDHSVKHMDALWTVSQSVFTCEEIDKFSVSEAFVLGSSFYFHDLGMSIAATQEGIQYLEQTESYKIFNQKAENLYKLSKEKARQIALRISARNEHAANAMKLANEIVPGFGRFVIEKEEIRITWGHYIGEVSASHHWSITLVEQKLGSRGVIPSPLGDEMDLGFIACALRIIDFAHINSDRANYLEKILRFEIDDESLMHWKAQEYINGPSRSDNKLKYVSYKPFDDVEAWWLFYDMALGLDREINAVAEYLNSKLWAKGRFSIEGVSNVKSPKSFSTLVRTLNFEPIDIRFKPDSIERLVDILGGKTLYGNDSYAPLRELIQNARDAILLRCKVEEENGNIDFIGRLTITVTISKLSSKLEVKDNGVGMTSNIIENYLLGIASDYWNSEDFYFEFPDAKQKGFSPTGKFGIGFLSVFMIGDIINLQTERRGKPRLMLNLKGLGKHGSLVNTTSTGNFGTSISITLSKQEPNIYSNLEMIIRARAPMLTFPIHVITPTQTSIIQPYWWRNTTQKDFFDFINNWDTLSGNDKRDKFNIEYYYYYLQSYNINEKRDFNDVNRFKKWPAKQPEIIDKNFRLLAIPDFGKVILCSRGIAIEYITLRGLTGIIEIENIELTASRDQTIKWDKSEFVQMVTQRIKPLIVDALNNLVNEGMITARFEFIKKVADTYGKGILVQTSLPWISIILQPGNINLLSADEIVKFLKNKNEILISYGIGPWNAENMIRSYFPNASDDAVVIPVNNIGQPGFGSYSSKDEIILETLPKQFLSENEKNLNKYEGAFFLTILLELIASSWNINKQKLIDAEWLRKKDSHLCVYFKKIELS